MKVDDKISNEPTIANGQGPFKNRILKKLTP